MLVHWNDGALSFFPESGAEETLLDTVVDGIASVGVVTLKKGRPWTVIAGSGSLMDSSENSFDGIVRRDCAKPRKIIRGESKDREAVGGTQKLR
jgi:hypothetical protein